MTPALRTLSLLVCLAACGCPGQRRPDPRWAARAAGAPAGPAAPAVGTPDAQPGSDGLAQRLVEARELAARFRAAPRDVAGFEALLAAIHRAEDESFTLAEKDPQAAERAQDELSALRDEVVRLDPRGGG